MARAQDRTTQNGAVAFDWTVPLTIMARVMTPIVFWASFVPWARDTIEADPICPIRKPCCRAPAVMLRLIRYSSHVPLAATSAAMIGDSPAGITTLATRLCHWTACPPAAAIVE